jgi:hypothetical protein
MVLYGSLGFATLVTAPRVPPKVESNVVPGSGPPADATVPALNVPPPPPAEFKDAVADVRPPPPPGAIILQDAFTTKTLFPPVPALPTAPVNAVPPSPTVTEQVLVNLFNGNVEITHAPPPPEAPLIVPFAAEPPPPPHIIINTISLPVNPAGFVHVPFVVKNCALTMPLYGPDGDETPEPPINNDGVLIAVELISELPTVNDVLSNILFVPIVIELEFTTIVLALIIDEYKAIFAFVFEVDNII